MKKFSQVFDSLPEYLKDEKLPWMQWVRFNGTEVVACVNLERSEEEKRPMIDISYCMTAAMNGLILQTVKYNPRSFKPSLIDV